MIRGSDLVIVDSCLFALARAFNKPASLRAPKLKVCFDLLYSIALQHNIALYQSYDQKDADNTDDDKA